MKLRKNSISKKVVSFVIVLSLLISAIGTSVFAGVGSNGLPDNEFPATSSTKANLSFEYLGTTATVGLNPNMPTNSEETITWAADEFLWIGVYVDSMTKLSSMFTTAGLSTMTLSLGFDSTYFEWSDTNATRVFKLISGSSHAKGFTTYPYTEDSGDYYPHYVVSSQTSSVGSYSSSTEYQYWGKLSLTNTEDLGNLGIAQVTTTFDDGTFGNSDQHMFQGSYLKDDKTLVCIFPLKMKGATAPAAGTKVLQGVFGASRFTLNASQDNAFNLGSASPAETNLSEKFNIINEGLVDLFPASVAVDGIRVSEKDSQEIARTQYYGTANPVDPTKQNVYKIDTSALEASYLVNGQPSSEVSTSDIKWYYSTNGAATSIGDLTEFTPGTTKWTAADTYYIYVAGKDKMDVLDDGGTAVAITVVQDTIAGITQNNVPTSGYAGSTIDFANLKANVTMASGDTFTVAYANFTNASDANRSIALYKKTGDAAPFTYTEINSTNDDAEAYPAVGSFVTYVVSEKLAPGATPVAGKSFEFAVTGDTDTLTVTNHAGMKLNYKPGAQLDPSGITATLTKQSGTGGGTLNWADIQADGNIDVVISSDINAALDVEVLDTANPMPNFDTAWGDAKKAYIRVNNGGTYTYVELGTLVKRTATDITVTSVNNGNPFTYGDKLGTVVISATFNDGNTETLTETVGGLVLPEVSKNEITEAGITMQIENAVGVVGPETQMVPASHGGRKLDFYVGGTKKASSAALVVNKAEIKVSFGAATDLNKTYDGTDTIATPINMTVANGPWKLPSDETDFNGKIAASGITFKYADRHAGADKAVKYSGTLAAAATGTGTETDVAEFNKKYVLVGDNAFFAADGTAVGLSGTISPATLTVKDTWFEIPSILQDDVANLTKDNTKGLLVADGLLNADDVVSVSYTYSYGTADDIDQPTDAAPVAITNIVLAGDHAGNYTPSATTANATGKVTPKEASSLAIKTEPTKAYTYPNKTLDLSAMEINVWFDGGSDAATSYTVADYLSTEPGAQIKLLTKDGVEVVSISSTTDMENVCDLPYGEYKLVISAGDEEDTEAPSVTLDGIVAKRKEIKLADLTLDFEKVYGEENDEAYTVATIASNAIVSGDVVTLDAEFTPENENAGEGKKVAVKLALTGDDADNYILVDEEGEPVDETEINDGIIFKADKAAPAAPVVTVDKYTNKLLIDFDGVNTAGLEYLVVKTSALNPQPTEENPSPTPLPIDEMDWFTAGDTTLPESEYFTGYSDTEKAVPYYYASATESAEEAERGESYTVLVRVAETENYYASATEEAAGNSYPYHVRVFMVGDNDNEMFAIYTNDDAIGAAEDDMSFSANVLDDWLPSRFKSFHSDWEGTSTVDYATLGDVLAENSGNLDMFYTRKRTSSSSSGGTSLGTNYTVTYDVAENGIITENDKTEKVASGKKPTEVPTVKAKDGFSFRGWTLDGKAIIDPTTVVITENVTFTALYKVVEEDKPIIDPKYIDPYATGYPDGSFMADKALTRAELAAMIARIHYEGELPDNTYYASFEDIQPTDWYNKYIGYVEGLGVMNGYPDGSFKPTQPITRAEFASVLVRAQKYELFISDDMFTDIADHWAKDYITTLGNLKIVNGYEDGTFLPENPLTRGEAVTMINRILEPSEIVGDNKPNDIEGHWAEDAIILAVNLRKLIEG